MCEQITLIVLADGGMARFLAQTDRYGALVELTEFRMQISSELRDNEYPEEVSGFFLADVASQISETMQKTSAGDLILCGEGEALASLRSFLGSACCPHLSTLSENVADQTLEDACSRLSDSGVFH